MRYAQCDSYAEQIDAIDLMMQFSARNDGTSKAQATNCIRLQVVRSRAGHPLWVSGSEELAGK
jgi:hypothetical protein